MFGVIGKINKLPTSDMGVLLSPLLRAWARVSSCSGALYQAVRRTRGRYEYTFRLAGGSLIGCGVLGKINKLPTSDMGVRDPLLAFGTPPPLGIELTSPKMRDLLLNFTKYLVVAPT